mmetsp:Transcript_32214/g.51276  ORF Transcript_32214/g.51276 Transcript_32214/m.51276 type:complete len:496 (+) Transcript_32214:12-1499(+)
MVKYSKAIDPGTGSAPSRAGRGVLMRTEESYDWKWAGIAGGLTACAMGLIVWNIRRLQQQALINSRLRAQQVERIDFTGDDLGKSGPGGGSPLFHGVKVVDLSTHVAGPSAARVMAELGAEVIKVEALEGDEFRNTLLEFEPTRKFASLFESPNLGKYSYSVDLKTKQGVDELLVLLEDADVLITSVRLKSLQKLGLDFESLAVRLPHLVYAQVSAWGVQGNEQGQAGFDIGAFWGATGMAALYHEESTRMYSSYPAAMGDRTTSQALLAGISMALAQRLETGKGQYVSTSLLHCGTWCVAPYIIEDERVDPGPKLRPLYHEKPVPDPLHCMYRTKDMRHIVILGKKTAPQPMEPFSDSESHSLGVQALCNALSLRRRKDVITGRALAMSCEDTYHLARKKIEGLLYSQVSELLDAHNIIHREYRYFQALWATQEPENGFNRSLAGEIPKDEQILFEASLQDTRLLEIEDLSKVAKLPYSFSCSTLHGAKKKSTF